MPAVFLLRHGQASFGKADYDVLSERGAEQASVLHAALEERGVRFDRLVSGSLRRQIDTALPWTSGGAQVTADPRWNEYDSADVVGAHADVPASPERIEGAPEMSSGDFQVILDRALTAWIDAGEDGPAGETWTAFRGRTVAALDDLVASLGSGETAAAFTSGGVIAVLAVAALKLPDQAFVALNRVGVNGAVTKLVSGRRGTTLVSFNEHAHLEPGGLVTYR